MMRVALALLPLVVWQMTAAVDPETFEKQYAKLRSNYKKWQELGIKDYEYRVSRRIMHGRGLAGPWKVTIKGGQTESVEKLEGRPDSPVSNLRWWDRHGRDTPGKIKAEFGTIDKVFKQALNEYKAIAADAADYVPEDYGELLIEFNQKYGFPKKYYSSVAELADDEQGWVVRNFRVLESV